MTEYFNVRSNDYKKYRPVYPTGLFDFLADIAPANDLAWDCGCGTGQATAALSDYFDHVIGTDVTEGQIKNAIKKQNIIYKVNSEKNSELKNKSVDLVTCAQSLHWLTLNKFYKEVKRVLKPGGIIAVWTYNLFRVSKEIDGLIDKFYFDIIYNYWPEQRKHVESKYTELDFPFSKRPAPQFSMEADWSLDQLIGYLNTWTGVQNYIEFEAFNPIEFIENELRAIWAKNKQTKKKIIWPLTIKVGKI
jgi:SAM-dependent methyltransferase